MLRWDGFMTRIASGIDLIEIVRLESAIQRQGERLLQRLFTPRELAEARGNVASLAARFAAKEAVAKALGTGIGLVTWHEIEILRGSANEPLLALHRSAAQKARELNLIHWSISLSHTHELATAIAIAIGE